MTDYRPLIDELNISQDEVEAVAVSANHNAMEIPKRILVALRGGSHDAYTEIFKAYHEPVRSFLAKIVRSEDDAQEITQDVFFHLWEKRDSIDPDKNIKGFLYTTAKFFTLSYFRHKKVIAKYEQYSGSGSNFAGPADESYITRELTLLTQIAIARMPRQQQQVFRMRYEECRTNEEIAALLNIKPETVRVHLSRGKQDIRDILVSLAIFFTLP